MKALNGGLLEVGEMWRHDGWHALLLGESLGGPKFKSQSSRCASMDCVENECTVYLMWGSVAAISLSGRDEFSIFQVFVSQK